LRRSLEQREQTAPHGHLACVSKLSSVVHWANRAESFLDDRLMARKPIFEGGTHWWIASEDDEAIRHRAAQAYDKYQKCGSAQLRLSHELKKTLERVALDSLISSVMDGNSVLM